MTRSRNGGVPSAGVLAAAGMAFGLVLGSCGLGVLSETPPPDAATPPDTGVLTVCDPANLPAGCDSICAQAQQILKQDCASCHSDGMTAGGPPTEILDYHTLVNVPAVLFPTWSYVVPGQPDSSLLYHRIAVVQDMPPPAQDPGISYPRPSVSDYGILAQWIGHCVPAIPGPDAGSPPIDAGS